MQIKKLLILTTMFLTSVCACHAQAQIEGFWGATLGDSETSVVRKIRQSYPSADYSRDTNGHPFIAKNVKLAGLDVDKCEIKFENGYFTKAQFNKVAGWRSINASQAQSYVASLNQQVQQDYQDFCEAISEKYGTPKVSGQTVTWRTSNGNSITIKPWSMTDTGYIDDRGMTWAGAGIHIIYTKGSHLNDF